MKYIFYPSKTASYSLVLGRKTTVKTTTSKKAGTISSHKVKKVIKKILIELQTHTYLTQIIYDQSRLVKKKKKENRFTDF